MTNVQVYNSELGIPLVRLTGQVNEHNGAELADKVMREINAATAVFGEFPHPLSLRTACVRVPDTWVERTAGG